MNEKERKILNDAVNINQIHADEYKNSAITEEISKYQQSPYFANFSSYCNGADQFSKELIEQYKMIYMSNLHSFKNPFYQSTKKGFFLNIGYPVPEYYLGILRDTYETSLVKNNDIVDSEFVISITPLEYSKDRSNIIKHSQGYQLQVQMVKKMEKSSELSK